MASAGSPTPPRSVGTAFAAHAACPVIVVRGTGGPAPDGPIVVGVDGSPPSDAALAFAVEVAVARKAPLRPVLAWMDNVVPYVVSKPVDWEGVATQEQELLTKRLAGWQEKYPDLVVEPVLTHDRPVHALVHNTGGAQLVVVGSRGRGGLAGMTLVGDPRVAAPRGVRCRRRALGPPSRTPPEPADP